MAYGVQFHRLHPHCRCYVIAKLPSREEMSKWNRMTDEEQASYHFEGEVSEVPKGYSDWMEKNAGRIENAKSVPYFIGDNYPDGEVGKGFVWEQKAGEDNRLDGSGMKANALTDEQRRQITLERAKQRHEARTAEQVEDIQARWNRHRIENNGDGYSLTSIERSINKYGVDRAEFDALMARPLKYDKRSYEFPELVALEDRYRDLADINVTKAAMKRGELFNLRLEAAKLGAKGKKYGERIESHIHKIDEMGNATVYWLSEKEAQQIASAKSKIAAMTKHREDVLKVWQERKVERSGELLANIAKADSPEALAKLMKDARIAKDFDLGDMPLKEQKTIAEVAANISKKWNLDPIDIRMKEFPKKDESTFMWAHGRMVEANSKYWSKDALPNTLREEFDNCVTARRKVLEDRLEHKKKWLEDLNKVNNGGSWFKKEIKKAEKAIAELEAMLNTGMSRHNVFLSPESMLRDCFTHETGHTVHDQILGGLNGAWSRKKMYSEADAAVLNKELEALWKKHKKLGGGWLSEYGMTKRNEFLSESFVLYNYAPEKLPADVKAWFDLLGDYAKTGKLPARDKMPSVAFKPEKKTRKKAKTASSISAEDAERIYRENYSNNKAIIKTADLKNGQLQIDAYADNNELLDNIRGAHAIIDSIPNTKISIRRHVISNDGIKNPEYEINGLIADRKGVEGINGIRSAFQKAIKQKCEAIVLDFDMHPDNFKRFLSDKVATMINSRYKDFIQGRIKECYVIRNGKCVRITSSMITEDIKHVKDELKQELRKLV